MQQYKKTQFCWIQSDAEFLVFFVVATEII